MNPRLSFTNEQLMMEQMAGAPMSIRQLAEQTYAMKEDNLKENAMRKQHDPVLFKRSIDPVVAHNRKKVPLDGIKRMTKDGLIGTNTEVSLARKEEELVVEEEAAPVAASNEDTPAESNNSWLVGAGISLVAVGFIVLLWILNN